MKEKEENLTNKDKLCYLLIYMHTSDTWAKLSMILHISANYLNEIHARITGDRFIQWFSAVMNNIPQEAIHFQKFPDAIAKVDSTLLPKSNQAMNLAREETKWNHMGCMNKKNYDDFTTYMTQKVRGKGLEVAQPFNVMKEDTKSYVVNAA